MLRRQHSNSPLLAASLALIAARAFQHAGTADIQEPLTQETWKCGFALSVACEIVTE